MTDMIDRVEQRQRRNIREAIEAVVNQTPQGAPADRLYAPLVLLIERDHFDRMMFVMVEQGVVTRRAKRYFPGPNYRVSTIPQRA